MDSILKVISTVLPFLDLYPPWVRGAVGAWLILTAIVLAILIAVPRSQSPARADAPAHRPQTVERGDSRPTAPRLLVIEPRAGSDVGEIEIVRGVSDAVAFNNYIIVTSLRTGGRWVVDGPLSISGQYAWEGRARFGSSNVGIGERYAVSVLATGLVLQEGELQAIPPGTYVSDSVTVRRTH
jgi:hypothetical protein